MKFIDVSVPLGANLPTYPGNTPFSLEPIKRIGRGESSKVSSLHMSAHAGTHVDAPRPFFDDRSGTDELPLELLFGRARVVEMPAGVDVIEREDLLGIEREDLLSFGGTPEIRVLIKTRNSGLWGSPEFHRDCVGRAETVARYLRERGTKVVGVDYLSIEQFRKLGAPAHHILLGSGGVVVEGVNLVDVQPGVYEMYCLPLRVIGSDGAPARVVLATD